MVWGLFPVGSLPAGAETYYFLKRGTYKVGRKGCDVTVLNDKGVSRIHAELVVDEMTPWNPLENMLDSFLSDVRIVDKSKYGTFINKEKGSKPLIELPHKETTLRNGDLVSFGTGNAVFRFSFVPLMFFIPCKNIFRVDPSLQDIITSIGACMTHDWNPGCTHVLADETSAASEDLIYAIMSKKPIIRCDWVKVVADKNICTELPNMSDYAPNIILEGESVKIVEPNSRENCLAGNTFVLGSPHLLLAQYKFGDRLKSLLEICGAKVLSVEDFCSSNQLFANDLKNPLMLVIPVGPVNDFKQSHQLNSLSTVADTKLIAAIFTGHFDSSIVESPSNEVTVVSSSNSSDETIVADSDVEMDTAISNDIARAAQPEEPLKCEEKENLLENNTSDKIKYSSFSGGIGGMIERRHNGDESMINENQNSDIIYSQELVVRDISATPLTFSAPKEKVVNFKCFRKGETPSGNSFKNLIPFSKYPYKESECGNEVAEYAKKEKKRKQLEAIAEDLFNNEKVRRRGTDGASLYNFLARR